MRLETFREIQTLFALGLSSALSYRLFILHYLDNGLTNSQVKDAPLLARVYCSFHSAGNISFQHYLKSKKGRLVCKKTVSEENY